MLKAIYNMIVCSQSGSRLAIRTFRSSASLEKTMQVTGPSERQLRESEERSGDSDDSDVIVTVDTGGGDAGERCGDANMVLHESRPQERHPSGEQNQKRSRRKTKKARQCPGNAAGASCVFSVSSPGEAVTHKGAMCMWCDDKHLARSIVNGRSKSQIMRALRAFQDKNEDVYEAALAKLPEDFDTSGGLCIGCEHGKCVYSNARPGQPARAIRGKTCVWCDPEALARSIKNQSRKGNLVKALHAFQKRDEAVYVSALAKLPEEFGTAGNLCMGEDGTRCVFSRARPGHPAVARMGKTCLWCDQDSLQRLLSTKLGTGNIIGALKDFEKKNSDVHAAACAKLPNDFDATRRKCSGRDGTACVFSRKCPGEPAFGNHNGKCMWCDEATLAANEKTKGGRGHIGASLNAFRKHEGDPDILQRALSFVSDEFKRRPDELVSMKRKRKEAKAEAALAERRAKEAAERAEARANIEPELTHGKREKPEECDWFDNFDCALQEDIGHRWRREREMETDRNSMKYKFRTLARKHYVEEEIPADVFD